MEAPRGEKRRRAHARWAAVLCCLLSLLGAPAAVAGWGPQRPAYDYNRYDPAYDDCRDPANPAADHGRCGALDGPVFNSFINTPSYGDERPFLDARVPQQELFSEALMLPADAKRVVIRAYVNNNANEVIGYRSVASGTTLQIILPTSSREMHLVGANLSADNATPSNVSDTVTLAAEREFKLEFVPGSARLLRGEASYQLSDSIVTGGAVIGDTVMNGSFPAGFDKAAVVEIDVRILPASSGGSAWWPWIGVALTLALLAGLLAFPSTRRRLLAPLQWWWGKLRDPAVHNQVVAGLVLLLFSALIGVLIKAAFG